MKPNKCIYCANAINPKNENQRFCNDEHEKRYLQHLATKNYKECPTIKNRDVMSENDVKLQEKWINKNKRLAKEKLVITKGKI